MAMESFLALGKDVNIKPFGMDEENDDDRVDAPLNFSNPFQLALPPIGHPVDNMKKFNRTEDGRPIKFDFQHGTTTLGFVYQGGVVLAVDSRATGGSYIGSQYVKKIVEINDYMLGTLAGGAADCIYWDRVLSKYCRLYELRNRERISVAAASKVMSNMIYGYKGMGLSIGMMLAGYDKRGASLYYMDNEGLRTAGKVFSVGSGSVYAYGVLDTGYHWDLTDEEACELGRRSITHATHRDAYSGGIVRVYHITAAGWKHITNQDSSELFYGYKAQNEN